MNHNSRRATPTPETPQKKRRLPWRILRLAWRLFSVGSKIGLVLVLLFAAYIAYTNWRGNKRMQAAFEALENNGIDADMQVSFFIGRPDEGDDDGARYYAAAFELLEAPWSEQEELPYVGCGDEPGLCEPLTGEMMDAVAAYVERKNDYFQALAKALEYRHPKHNIRFYGVNNNGNKILSDLRSFARHQNLVSLVAQAKGQVEAACDACSAIFEVSITFENEQLAIVQAIRRIINEMACRQIEQILSRMSPTSANLETLQHRALEAGEGLDFKRTVRTELALMGGTLRFLGYWHAQHELSLREMLAAQSYAVTRKGEGLGERRLLVFPEQVNEDERNKMEDSARRGADLGRFWLMLCPGSYKVWFAEDIELTLKEYSDMDIPDHVFAKRFAASGGQRREEWLYGGRIRLLEGRARCRCAAVALSAEAYRRKKGKWPEHLDEVDQGHLLDPFSGEPLKCRRVQEGFTVYSVGRNLTDDEGIRSERPSRNGVWPKDDLAFRLFDPERRNVKAHQAEDAESEPQSD